jgi:HAE1 family hydrophobic/amphiphilic exporter-1
VVATTLATCAVFVPIAFMGGVVGRFFREFGLVAASAVLASMLVSLTLTPMLCARYLRVRREQGRVFWTLERGYRWLEGHYRRALAWGLAHRATVMGIALAAVAGGVVLAGRVPIDFVTQEDRAEFNVWVKRPLGSNLAQTQDAVERVEALLREMPEVRITFSTIGAGAKKRVDEAQIYVQIVHKSERDRSQQEVMNAVRERIRALDLPLRDFSVEEIGIISMPGARNAQLMYSFRGPSIERLQLYAQTLLERLRESGGYADLSLSYETGKPEIALDITRERAADLGVPALQIGRTVSALYAGYKAASFEEGGERYDVRVQVRPEYRDDLAKLDLVRVRSTSGALVPLRNLATPRIGSGPVQIDRESRTRAITLYGNLAGKSAGEADGEIAAIAREMQLDAEYSFDAVGPSKRLRETTSAVLFAFALALVAIYMILAAQFDSFVHPATVMLSAPLSFIGAFALIWATGQSLDVMGQIAFLMLMGIVMKNGILLVDYINTLRARGLPLREAVLQAGPTRMRPVLMTAVSTIFGMLPVALGAGDGSEWRSPMATVAIGGLLTSTALTLLVVPVAYTLVDDAQRSIERVSARLAGRGAVADGAKSS